MGLEHDDDEDVTPPGFRFHPTDEELVGFYLRRKVGNKPIRLQLIGQADIYKFDPWDLPKSSLTGDNEWYFFCKRGRKYKNSVRPNRVTGSGFWKATGIDKPIHSSSGGGGCIGLKKSLVYYRGRAGKGTKTEWMMHEFRLAEGTGDRPINPKNIDQEAEVWTLCRILQRNTPNRRYGPDWRSGSSTTARRGGVVLNPGVDAQSDTCSVESSDQNGLITNYISFDARGYTSITDRQPQKPYPGVVGLGIDIIPGDHQDSSMLPAGQINSSVTYEAAAASAASSFSSYMVDHSSGNEALLDGEDWEDLRSVVNCGAANHYCSFYL